MTNVNIIGSAHEISSQVYPQTIFLVTQMYTNIKIHQYNTTQLNWIHMVHTFNI